MVAAPFVTIIARKFNTRLPMMIGITLLAVGYISASFAGRIWQLYLSQGVLIGLGVGFTYVPSIAIISQWFEKKRSLANGISAAGSGIGGLIYSFAADSIIRNISVAWSFRITALTCCSMLFIAAILMKSRNEAVQPFQRGFDVGLLRRTDVILLLAWAFCSMLGYIVLLYSLPDFARSIGLSDNQAATINALLNLGTALGRPVIGITSDRYGRFKIASLLTLTCGLACFAIWLPSTVYGPLILFSLISGAILGVFWVVSQNPLSMKYHSFTHSYFIRQLVRSALKLQA
ncbi:MAG: hypothetical protein M4579_000416 [Chaenotheca gracillima]|nr:MAG: hypothetical protein M4579_000416 [Chaenotheca gracillima]